MEQSEEEACLFAMRLATGSVLPMVLKSVIELNLLELIKKAGTSASASQLAAQLPVNNPNAVVMIDRLLRILSAHSILISSHTPTPGSSGVERHYALAPVCKFLTENEDGVSIAPLLLMNQDKVFMESWYHLKDAVLDGGIPFDRAHKVSVYEFPAGDPRINKLFNSSMYEPSTIILRKIVETYKGFEGVKSLVDVGGGTGAALNMIISKYPSIRGINFDLPHVAKAAPPSPGVEHVGGDMFISVPKADAIFLKWVCHNWSDDYVQKVFNNCYEALPDDGKLIVAEYVLPEDPNSGEMDYSEVVDLAMMAYTQGGKERTQREFETLAKGAGFKKLHKVCSAYSVWVMELYK